MAELRVLESRYSRRMGSALFAVSAVALVLGLWWWHFLLLLVGGLGTPTGLWMLLDRRVKLRVDEVGILYAPWGPRPLQWSEIEAVAVCTLRKVEQVCIVPADPALLLERMGFWVRWGSLLMKLTWGSRFVISTSSLEHGTPYLLAALRQYHAVRTGSGAA